MGQVMLLAVPGFLWATRMTILSELCTHFIYFSPTMSTALIISLSGKTPLKLYQNVYNIEIIKKYSQSFFDYTSLTDHRSAVNSALL